MSWLLLNNAAGTIASAISWAALRVALTFAGWALRFGQEDGSDGLHDEVHGSA